MKIFVLFIYFIKIIFILAEDNIINNFECPRERPLLNGKNECVYEYYEETKHNISNSFIKEQWLNRRNPIGIIETRYMNSDLNSKGDLITVSFPFEKNTTNIRFIYGIKSNGRALFYEEESNEFIYQINMTTSELQKYESQLV